MLEAWTNDYGGCESQSAQQRDNLDRCAMCVGAAHRHQDSLRLRPLSPMERDLGIKNEVFVAAGYAPAAKRLASREGQCGYVQIGKRRTGAAIVERRKRNAGLFHRLCLRQIGIEPIVDP